MQSFFLTFTSDSVNHFNIYCLISSFCITSIFCFCYFVFTFYLWLCCVFVAAHGLSLVAPSSGFSCCRVWVPGTQALLVAAHGVGS